MQIFNTRIRFVMPFFSTKDLFKLVSSKPAIDSDNRGISIHETDLTKKINDLGSDGKEPPTLR